MDVLFEEMHGVDGHVGIITLNRPEVLNSLNAAMIAAMYPQLKVWADAAAIKAVIIRAAPGRAFCAGGDLRLTHQRYHAKDPALPHFFRDEYQLNRLIHHYPKPYIALLDGITMGGGVGISIHGSHRVATERLLFAMPETGIGFFPDVGGTYFLPRLSGRMGYYLGLTGARLSSDDCVSLTLAQYKVTPSDLPALIEKIAATSLKGDAKAIVSHIIAAFKVAIPPSALLEQQTEIDRCFSFNTMEEVVAALSTATGPACLAAMGALQKKSPTSLKVTLAALHQGAALDFDACMHQEYRLACHFTEGHDFIEGIRAVIIDKDQQPKWRPDTLAGVSPQAVARYFSPTANEPA